MKLGELASILEGRLSGDPHSEITAVAGIREAKEGDIACLLDKKYLQDIIVSHASAIIVGEQYAEQVDKKEAVPVNMVFVDSPLAAFAKALELFHVKPLTPIGVSAQAKTGKNVTLGSVISLYPFTYVGDNVSIGERVTVFPGAYIGDGVSIDDDTVIHPNVTIREKVTIGKRVHIHAGTVIGSDGFGYVLEEGRHHKIPQVGGVIIEDDVEIGSNVSIDRATIGNTIIGCGTKIDNLVQIAHNVRIGKNSVVVAQVGISGSAQLGNGVVLAGQVGIRDHVTLGDGAVIAAQSGVTGDIPEGQTYSGMPAMPHKKWLRSQSVYTKLPEYVKRLQALERKIELISDVISHRITKEDQPDDE